MAQLQTKEIGSCAKLVVTHNQQIRLTMVIAEVL